MLLVQLSWREVVGDYLSLLLPSLIHRRHKDVARNAHGFDNVHVGTVRVYCALCLQKVVHSFPIAQHDSGRRSKLQREDLSVLVRPLDEPEKQLNYQHKSHSTLCEEQGCQEGAKLWVWYFWCKPVEGI